jgi:hypothetical protein
MPGRQRTCFLVSATLVAVMAACTHHGNIGAQNSRPEADSDSARSFEVGRFDAKAFDAGGSDANLALDADLCAYTPFDVTDAGVCVIPNLASTVSLGVDAGSCENRPTVPCNGQCDSQMADVASTCGGLPVETSFVVTFSQGCADHLYPSPGLSALFPTIVNCLARGLDESRFACAEQSRCLGYSYSTLP